MKNTIEKLNSLLYSATKKRPDGPPSVLSGAESEKENNERDKLKSFLAETLAKQLVQKGMKDVTEYELHQIVYAIATKTSLGKDFTHLEFQALYRPSSISAVLISAMFDLPWFILLSYFPPL